MKILFIQKIKGIAGSERYFLQLIPALNQAGFCVEFLVLHMHPRESNEFISALRLLNIPCHTHVLNILSPVTLSRYIVHLVEINHFHAVHTHLIHADFYGALAVSVAGLKVPVLSTKHGYDEAYQREYGLEIKKRKKYSIYYLMARFAEKRIAKSFAVSHGLSRLFYEFNITAYEMPVVWHGILPSDTTPYINGGVGNFNILVIGRLEKFKGHHLLLEALSKNRENFDLHIVGDGSMRNSLELQVVRLGIKEKVTFHGYINDVESFYTQSDLVISPSIGEGFGLVVIEAFAAAKPVIAFDVPAYNELIENGKNGLLIKPFDTDALSMAISALIQNRAYLNRLSIGALQSVQDRFHFKNTLEKTLQFYKDNLRI